MSAPPLLVLREVRRAYGGAWSLDLPSFEVSPGELLAIVGPTGAGKSTLLRLLHLLEAPQQGRVWYDGAPVEPPAPLVVRRSIGMVFQRPLMLSGTVRHNVEYGLHLRGRRDGRRVAELLESFDLVALAGRDASMISGGEMQRVALARAVAARPRLLLLDEPAANLDPGHVAVIEGIIRGLHRQGDTTVVLATHHLEQARRLAQRVGMLAGGRLVEIGEAGSFFARPRHALTAAFLRGELLTEDHVRP